MTATELKKRAIALAEKTKIDSVTPEEVGQLSNDIVEYIENVEINGSSLGIRKTYTSVSAMEADSNAPKDDKGVLLRRGMLVNIYNQSEPDSADNGKVFSFQNPGWAFRGTIYAGYATRDELTELLNAKAEGAAGDGKTDDTVALQAVFDKAYAERKRVYIPAGTYVVTRALYIYDGIEIQGDGIYNTVLKTPFSKSEAARAFVTRDKEKNYNTLTNPDTVPQLDITAGHNRFYLGDGVVGYYDSDRDTNPSHPLYWPNDGSGDWKKWKAERDKIVSTGRWIGLTGRENYSEGLIKSSQCPGLRYEDYGGSRTKPCGTIHTGIRNVKISDLQITTNSSDRGKDSAINFQYKASEIPARIRETYDSSVLNIQLYNLYLFSLGKSGYRATRAVDHMIAGCYIRQCAEQGIYLDGVTSITISGCYCNSCLEGGYVLKGVNYSSIVGCAADSCSIGYNLYNCKGVSLISCGSEATRYQPAAEDAEEDPYKGRAFSIRNCDGVSLVSCYTMTSHPKVYADDVLDVTDEEADPNWQKSRHVMVMQSQNVNVSYCHFKCFERIRTTPFRDADNNKVNFQGGDYDPAQAGSRYWQVQNYLVGAQFEIRGEESSVNIIGSKSKNDMIKTSEVRVGNLDILDPGTVVNPLASNGYSTAGKTLSGDDGNGGWTDGSGKRISFENFEYVFPINAKSAYGKRDYFWAWRNSLILVRRKNDTSLQKDYPTRYMGYVDVLNGGKTDSPVNWSTVTESDFAKFRFYIERDYQSTSFIDGSKSLFTYGKFAWQQLDKPVAYEPQIFTPIPAFVRDKPEGHRVALNTNDITEYPAVVKQAAVSVIGNKYKSATETTDEVIPGIPFVVLSPLKSAELAEDTRVMACTNLDGKDYFSVYAKGKAVSVGGRRFISPEASDLEVIPKLDISGADASQIAGRVNALIDRLTAHGLIAPQENAVVFSDFWVEGFTQEAAVVMFKVAHDIPIYKVGMAYSTSNAEPTINQNSVAATYESGKGYYLAESIAVTTQRYVRAYVEISAAGGASIRIYSETYLLTWNGNHVDIAAVKSM